MLSSNVLKIENFRRLWMGQAVSQFGDSLYALLFLFMVDKITGSAAMVGYVGALEALPFILLAPYAGVIADRLDRRKVMLFADLASAGILFAFTLLLVFNPKPPVGVIFVVALLLSLVNVFFMPAKSAAIPSLVPTEHLMEANALSSATQSMMPMLGLALSGSVLGLLYALAPNTFFPTAALLNAISFLFSAYCIARLPRLVPKREAAHIERHPIQDALDGFRLIRRDHVLWMVLLLNLLVHLFISPFMVAYVAVNRAWFGGGFGTLAACEAGFLAVMVVTSLALGKRKFQRPGMGYIVGSAVVGLFVAAMAFSQNFWLFFAWNALCGIALPFITIPLTTYVQRIVPDAYLGRVNSTMMMVSRAVTPLSMGLAGILLDKVGLVNMFLIMGFGMCGAALIGLFDPKFREARMPGDVPTHAEKPQTETVLAT
jgi:MFS family permease